MKKIPANFNVAKFNTILYFLLSQFNEETHVYILCIIVQKLYGMPTDDKQQFNSQISPSVLL